MGKHELYSYKNYKQILKAIRQKHTDQDSITILISKLHHFFSFETFYEIFMVHCTKQITKNYFQISILYLNNKLTNPVNRYKSKLFHLTTHSVPVLNIFSKSSLVAGFILTMAAKHRAMILLHTIISTLQCIKNSSIFVDLLGFLFPSIKTGDQLGLDMTLSICKI